LLRKQQPRHIIHQNRLTVFQPNPAAAAPRWRSGLWGSSGVALGGDMFKTARGGKDKARKQRFLKKARKNFCKFAGEAFQLLSAA
jgi:hypothetical protein